MSVKNEGLKKEKILEQLEELAQRLLVKITYDSLREGNINTRGGLCKVSGNYRILVEKRLTTKEKIDIIANSIARFDINDYYMPPEIRDIIASLSALSAEQAGDRQD